MIKFINKTQPDKVIAVSTYGGEDFEKFLKKNTVPLSKIKPEADVKKTYLTKEDIRKAINFLRK